MNVIMAQSYTDSLSDNVKRSLDHKVRKGGVIMNIAFNRHGIATWAAYLDSEQGRTLKGRFHVEDGVSYIEKTIIQYITDALKHTVSSLIIQ